MRDKIIEDNEELIEIKKNDPNFLKALMTTSSFIKGLLNKGCCCASTIPHDEAMKFIILGKD